jgi:hypothetical protein
MPDTEYIFERILIVLLIGCQVYIFVISQSGYLIGFWTVFQDSQFEFLGELFVKVF